MGCAVLAEMRAGAVGGDAPVLWRCAHAVLCRHNVKSEAVERQTKVRMNVNG